MTDVDALTAFCRARLEEERAVAEAAMTEIDAQGMYSHGEWSAEADFVHDRTRQYTRDDDCADSEDPRHPSWATVVTVDRFGQPGEAVRAHIARQDPAATLARVAALQHLVVVLERSWYSPEVENSAETALAEDGLRGLAASGRDHPDYREEWKP